MVSLLEFLLLQRNAMITIHIGEKRGYLACTDMSLFIIEGSEHKHSNRSGNCRQEIRQRIFYRNQNYQPRAGTTNNALGRPASILIKKILYRAPYNPIL